MRISFVVGLRLAQVGEFSLILSAVALDQGLFDAYQYQLLLIVSILSMLFAPLLIQVSTALSIRIFSKWKSQETDSEQKKDSELSGHVIIVGYGLGGRTLAQVLLETQIPFLVLDLDGEQIKRALTEGITTHYGDCAQEETLSRAGLEQARMVVFSISDSRFRKKF